MDRPFVAAAWKLTGPPALTSKRLRSHHPKGGTGPRWAPASLITLTCESPSGRRGSRGQLLFSQGARLLQDEAPLPSNLTPSPPPPPPGLHRCLQIISFRLSPLILCPARRFSPPMASLSPFCPESPSPAFADNTQAAFQCLYSLRETSPNKFKAKTNKPRKHRQVS